VARAQPDEAPLVVQEAAFEERRTSPGTPRLPRG
jgi:hypothetical protein